MRNISEQELKDILDKHGKWLRGDAGGERANLSYADLSYANLRSADLSYANLFLTMGFKFKPLQVVNTRYFITIFDDYVQWGCRKMTFDEVKCFQFADCTSQWDENEFKLNKKIITEMIRYYRPSDKTNDPRCRHFRNNQSGSLSVGICKRNFLHRLVQSDEGDQPEGGGMRILAYVFLILNATLLGVNLVNHRHDLAIFNSLGLMILVSSLIYLDARERRI